MSEQITYQIACRRGRCEGFLCRCIAERLAELIDESNDLRSVLTALDIRIEADGVWTMPCPGDFPQRIPVPGLSPAAAGTTEGEGETP